MGLLAFSGLFWRFFGQSLGIAAPHTQNLPNSTSNCGILPWFGQGLGSAVANAQNTAKSAAKSFQRRFPKACLACQEKVRGKIIGHLVVYSLIKEETGNCLDNQNIRQEDNIMNNKNRHHAAQEKGISYFGALLSVIMGYVVQNAMFTFSEVNMKEVPVLVVVALWFIFTTMFMVALDKLGV